MRKRVFDLNGFDVVLQLPAWVLFSMLLTIPGTCFLLVWFTKDAIRLYAVWVLVGLAALWIVTLMSLYLIVGAFARAASGLVAAILNRPRDARPPMIVMPPGAPMMTEPRPLPTGQIPWQVEQTERSGK